MITKFNHVAIAVVNLKEAINLYKNILGGKVSEIYDYPNHGVSVSFVELENTKIELMQPLGDNSPINNFLEKNKNGGIHHICIEVNDIFKDLAKLVDEQTDDIIEISENVRGKDVFKMRDKLLSKNMKILGDGEPKIGAHNKPVLFLHPKEFNGTLIELEQE